MTHGPKSKSKRTTLRLKFNIAKKSKEKRRKMKKLAKKHPELVPRKSKKDPGIPNLWPYKEALLEKAERQKAKLDEEQQRQREARKAVLDKKRKAVSKDAEVRAISASIKAPEMKHNDKSAQRARWYMRDLKKVVEKADVILEVLDARDPLGCRCLAVERMIQGAMSEKSAKQKKIILVLNKIDLVPAEVVQAWVKYLRREFPVVAFKASTQKQGNHLAASNAKLSDVAKDEDILKTSASVGAHALIELLKKYSLSLNLKTAISVGIIGYPNVGKSSVINSLKRSKAVGVGSTPGLTKSVTMVRLDKHIELLDSPGVLFDAEQTESDLVLRNALKVEQVEDPVMAVAAVVEKCSPEALMEVYKVPAFSDADEFLMHIGIKKGKLGKGGVPEIKAAARAVLRDWNEGKIPYYTVPPEIKADVAEDAKIVSDWSKSIDVDKLLEETNAAALSGLKSVKEAGAFMQFKASQPSNTDLSAMDSDDEDYGVLGATGQSAMEAKEDEAEDAEVDEDGAQDMTTDEPMGAGAGGKRIVIDTAKAFKKEEKKQSSVSQSKKLASPEDLLNPTTNRDLKKAMKKNKKAERKQQRRSEAGPADMDDEHEDGAQDIEEEEDSAPVQIKAFNPDDDSYDFDRDFGA